MNKPSHVLASALFPLLLAGCTAGPDYQRPAMDMPAQWPSSNLTEDKTSQLTVSGTGDQWWHIYNDAFLDQLEDEALQHNSDVQLVLSRVMQARVQLGISEADQSPIVTLNANENRTQSTLAGTVPRPATIPRVQNDSKVTLNASYELDLWGKLRRANEAARDALLAAESNKESVRLTLTDQVARQYFSLVSLDRQEAVLQRILEGRQERLEMDRSRLAAGSLSEYDLHQSEADVASVQTQLVSLRQSREQQETVLALLIGRSPRDVLNVSGLNRGSPKPVSVSVPEGLPAELLLRRPDLKAAEANLAAMNANIGVLRAQYFPSISLTAYLGSESSAFAQLFSGPAGIFQFAADISQPIFNAGRLENLKKAAEIQRDQALITYRNAVASAFADVRNALSAQQAAREMLELEATRGKALGQAYNQAKLRYDRGVTSRLELLDVERNYFLAELNRLNAENAQLSAVADLFKALGGGWREPVAGSQ